MIPSSEQYLNECCTMMPSTNASNYSSPTEFEPPINHAISHSLTDYASQPHTNHAPISSQEVLSVLSTVQKYFHTIGCAVIADAHLDGRAAVVHMTDTGTVYAHVNYLIFTQIIEDIITETSALSTLTEEKQATLVDLVLLAHETQFKNVVSECGIDPVTDANWVRFSDRSKTDRSVTPVAFSVSHPMKSLHTHPSLPERAIGLVAGIQRLTRDLTGGHSQQDVATMYLHAYLREYGATEAQAISTLSEWYNSPQEYVNHVLLDSPDLRSTTSMSDTPCVTYYLSEQVHNRLFSV